MNTVKTALNPSHGRQVEKERNLKLHQVERLEQTGQLSSEMETGDNKMELFNLLAISVYTIENCLIYDSLKDSSVCNTIVRAQLLCTQDEADTRIFFHLKYAVEKDYITTAAIQCNDVDIIFIAVSFFHTLRKSGLGELWVSFAISRTKKWYPIHDLANKLGPSTSKGLLFFHALSGCDTLSAFRNKSKKTFYNTWTVFPEITDCFVKLSTYPFTIEETDMKLIELFIVLVYVKSSIDDNVDITRKNCSCRTTHNLTGFHIYITSLEQLIKQE